jgi:glycosyltransferase involved in cell wall biosynthesis
VDHFGRVFEYDEFVDHYSTDNLKVVESLAEKVNYSKISRIPNGINCSVDYNPVLCDRLKVRTDLGLEEKDLAVFFIGRLSSEKKPDSFLRAAKIIINRSDDIKFYVVGDGPLRKFVEVFIRKEGGRNIRYLGYQPSVAKYLSAADIFVLPSLIEGFPLSVLEAMAMETVVIASNVGALKEIIEDEKEGFIVKPGSAKEISEVILKLSKNPKLLKTVAMNSRKNVEKQFSTEILGEKYTKMYQEMAEKK